MTSPHPHLQPYFWPLNHGEILFSGFLKLELESEARGGLVKTQIAGPTKEVSDSDNFHF